MTTAVVVGTANHYVVDAAAGTAMVLLADVIARWLEGRQIRRPPRAGRPAAGFAGAAETPVDTQSSSCRMSAAVRPAPVPSVPLITLPNSAAFVAFSAMTFSSTVSLATRR